ncbi:hypothetical protein OC842_000828 [Tilletia horrida]|uniref:HORMA domain-containing protein n=1 Tax=Tilletia horrida TaxID=155126 RepID=A0AAN6GGT7_9BASI|nr:hypothetical protein OC842_000828 [Tilletia horrida]
MSIPQVKVFQRRKKYSTPVYQVRHPGLANYIGMIIKSVKAELYKASVERVVLVIADSSDNVPLERFVFYLDYLIPVPAPRDRDLSIENAPSLHELELYLRSFMLKLMLIESTLQALPDPENTTFSVLLEYKDGHGPTSDDKNEPEEGAWVPADRPSSSAERGTADSTDSRPAFVPIKTFESGVINLMLHVEDDVSAKATHKASMQPASSRGAAASQRRGHEDEDEEAGSNSPKFGEGGEDGSILGFGMSDDGEGDWR